MAYSRAVAHGDWCFVSGTTYGEADDIAGQAEGALAIIAAALDQAGFAMDDVVRVRYLVADAAEFDQCWPVLRKWFTDVKPAATMEQVGLIAPHLRIEIEATAYRPGREG